MWRRRMIVLATLVALGGLLIPEADARPRVIRRATGIKKSQQPAYPKSMRTRGLKQLGPVPALGGVRSLRYWGGER